MISSLMTPCAKISDEKWCVTAVKRRTDNHALLVFEGIDSFGERFVKIAHFMGKGGRSISETVDKVFGKECSKRIGGVVDEIKKGTCLSLRKIGNIDIEKKEVHKFKNIFYGSKTPTWILTKEKVDALIKKIESEKGKSYPFHFGGKTSFLSKTAEAYDIYDPLFGKLAEENEDLFLKLYDSYCNEQNPTGMTEEAFDKVISKTLDVLRTEDPELFEDGVEYNYSYFMQLFEKEEIASKELEEHNCFTWAKHQLSYLGIELGETGIFKTISKLRL